MSCRCQEINTVLEGVKTPSFPKQIIPTIINEQGNVQCIEFGFNEEKTQFYLEFPVICNYIKEYIPPKILNSLMPMNPEQARKNEKRITEQIKEVLKLIEDGQLDKAMEIIQFLKLKF